MVRKGILLLILVCSVGCQPWASPEEYGNGLVVVLPGVGGGMGTTTVCEGLQNGGVDYAIEMFPWTSPWGVLDSLQNVDRNRREAGEIADRIIAYQNEYPGRPVFLVGHSGGGGIAIWAAEALPEDRAIDGIVLVSPALSPNYDLRPAMARSRGGVVNFYSELDWVILGAGTTIYGTIDRENVDSAGMVGFASNDPSGETYTQLYQVPWTAHSIEKGHLGGHTTSGSVWLIEEDVAPLILGDFSEESIQALRRKVFASQAESMW
jgi:pimeloyl-ACP methyl ester carboxylesterase